MGKTLRDIGSIAVGFVGYTLGGPLGFAAATLLYNWIVPPKLPSLDTPSTFGDQFSRSNAAGSMIREVYGRYEVVGGSLLRVARDSGGHRAGIAQHTVSSTSGGGGSAFFSAPTQTSTTVEARINASFGLCRGFTYIDRMIEVNSVEGEKVIYDRFADVVGIVFTPVTGPVSGELIGELSTHVRFWYGSEEQPQDAIEMQWYDNEGGCTADRGITKVVLTNYGPIQSGVTFRFLLRNALTNRRQIIEAKLAEAGLPASRVDLQSINATAADTGWLVEDIQPARQLCEQVAAVSLHDLAFLATSRGLALRDFARANPTYIVINEDQMGAYAVTGNGAAPTSSSIQFESFEKRPRMVILNYIDYQYNWQTLPVQSLWSSETGDAVTVELRWVTEAQTATDLVDITHAELIAAKGSQEVALMPAFAEVAMGCVLIVPEVSAGAPNGVRLLRVMNQPLQGAGILLCQCVPYDPVAYGRHRPVDQPTAVAPTITVYDVPIIYFIDAVPLTDLMAQQATALAVCYTLRADPWSGAYLRSASKVFADTVIAGRGTVGASMTAYTYTDADLYGFDYTTVLRVQINDGVLASTTEDGVRNGANLLWWGGFYLQYVTATPVAGHLYQYDLTGLLPGIKGSDSVKTAGVGATVIRITDEAGEIDSGVLLVPLARNKLRQAMTYEAYAVADPDKTTGATAITFQGNTLVPLSPAPDVVKGGDGAGGYYVKLFARSRYPESEEAYWQSGAKLTFPDPLSFVISLTDGGVVVDTRTVTSTTAEVTAHYTQAELLAMFGGSVPATLTGTVYQEGAYYDGILRSFVGI